MKLLKRITTMCLLFSIALLQGCGYKLGGLESIGDNSSKTASIKLISPKSLKQKFVNAGFKLDENKFEFLVEVEGPFQKKETSSITSSATEREFTLTVTMIVSVTNDAGKVLIDRKYLSKSRDHTFSSSTINSSESEENIINGEINKSLEVDIINILRSVI